jgi:transcriptional regulator with XRE-family HTH domain
VDKLPITLKAARVNNNMTQSEAAKKIGITVDTLSNYERGKSYPDVPIIKKIEEVYGLTYSDIIFLPKNYGKTVR